MFLFRNSEGNTAYNFELGNARQDGITAMLRVKDEADLLENTVLNIIQYFDQIVIFVQPSQDDTKKIAIRISNDYPSVKTYFYDYPSQANGPDYIHQDPNSLYSRTYFYNWSLSKVYTTRVCKWDADMRFINKALALRFINSSSKYVIVHGNECKSFTDLTLRPANRLYTPSEVRIFPLRNSYFVNGQLCEQLNYYRVNSLKRISNLINTNTIKQPIFNHFKYARSEQHITKSWPDKWREIEHFKKIYGEPNE